jgi:type II secretory pathway component GspD/PulD (secretin)
MKRLAALTLFCGILALNPGTAQDRKTTPPDASPPKSLRTLYAVQNGDATILAEVVGRHFKGEANVIAAPAGSGNAILISGAPTTVPEVVKLLEQLDKKPRTIEVEITIAEVPARDGQEIAPEDVRAGQRIKLTAVEGQPISTQTGGNKPYVSGTAVAGGGGFGKGGGGAPFVQKSVNYQPVGATVRLTARVGSDNAVAVDLDLKDSRVKPPDAADEAGAPTFENMNLTTKLSVPAGKSVVAQAVRSEGKAGVTVSVVIVTARVVDERPVTKGK